MLRNLNIYDQLRIEQTQTQLEQTTVCLVNANCSVATENTKKLGWDPMLRWFFTGEHSHITSTIIKIGFRSSWVSHSSLIRSDPVGAWRASPNRSRVISALFIYRQGQHQNWMSNNIWIKWKDSSFAARYEWLRLVDMHKQRLRAYKFFYTQKKHSYFHLLPLLRIPFSYLFVCTYVCLSRVWWESHLRCRCDERPRPPPMSSPSASPTLAHYYIPSLWQAPSASPPLNSH